MHLITGQAACQLQIPELDKSIVECFASILDCRRGILWPALDPALHVFDQLASVVEPFARSAGCWLHRVVCTFPFAMFSFPFRSTDSCLHLCLVDVVEVGIKLVAPGVSTPAIVAASTISVLRC